MAFSDVRRNRHGGATDLRDESKSLVGWKLLPHVVRLYNQTNTELPDVQIAIATDHRVGIRGRVQGKAMFSIGVTDPLHLQPPAS